MTQRAMLRRWSNGGARRPDADIAAVPDLSGHFVLAAVGNRGLASFDALKKQYGALFPGFHDRNEVG